MVILKREVNEEIKMDKISASEKKRVESIKHKKQIFRAKELAVQNALKNLVNMFKLILSNILSFYVIFFIYHIYFYRIIIQIKIK